MGGSSKGGGGGEAVGGGLNDISPPTNYVEMGSQAGDITRVPANYVQQNPAMVQEGSVGPTSSGGPAFDTQKFMAALKNMPPPAALRDPGSVGMAVPIAAQNAERVSVNLPQVRSGGGSHTAQAANFLKAMGEFISPGGGRK